MTPKEKAEELFSTYRYALSIPNASLGEYKDNVAKQCALIAVNEVLGDMGADRGYAFWTEVKEEIEKL